MDSTILAAIVGGSFTVAASIITFAITRIFDSNLSPHTKNVRQISLTGHWEGISRQEIGPGGTLMNIRVTATIKSTRGIVQGESIHRIHLGKRDITQHLSFSGKFVYDRFLKLEYEAINMPGSVQFGYILLELSPDGQMLEGRFLGFGAISRNITWGTVQLHKQEAILHVSAPSQTSF